jgi:dihydroorotate dehydrogenase
MYKSLRPLFFKMDPELAHNLIINLLRMGGSMELGRFLIKSLFQARQQGPEVQAFGLKFSNPLGMAAGFDKDGIAWRGLSGLGFGHVEIGTVTPRPQPGNPKPRLFRLKEDDAVINRNGFYNHGAEYMLRHLKARKPDGLVLGVNIGKNKNITNGLAVQDYLKLVDTFAPVADYLAVNVSSPNTPGLRELQSRDALEGLLKPLVQRRDQLENQIGKRTPILVKLAPDLDDGELEGSLEAVENSRMDGVIIGNTTVSRPPLVSRYAGEIGGLSGHPLNRLNTYMVSRAVNKLGGRLPVVASGGVMTPADAQSKLDAGASLVQLYTGLVYSGPGFVRDCLNCGLTVH